MNVRSVKGNTYCIDTGREYIPFYKINNKDIVMLDTGLFEEERRKIDLLLEEMEFNVVAIICTHVHIDHIGNSEYLRKKYNCKVAMSEGEAFLCKNIMNLKILYGSLSLRDIENYFGHMLVKVEIIIKDNDKKVNVGGANFIITRTPGHTIDHICITTPDNVTYLGDSLMSYDVINSSKMPYAFNIKEELRSKEKIRTLDSSRYIVAHKGIYNEINGLIDENIDFYKTTAEKILRLIDEVMTKEELIRRIAKEFNINIRNIRKYNLIERIVNSYIDYLIETKKINVLLDDGVIKYIIVDM